MKRKPARKRAQASAKSAPTRTSRGSPSDVKSVHPKSSRDKVKAHRERMRKRGMKLIQIWVPDPQSPYFAAEARRQARALARSPHEKDDQAFIDSISEWKPG
jgi:hypothetical protein